MLSHLRLTDLAETALTALARLPDLVRGQSASGGGRVHKNSRRGPVVKLADGWVPRTPHERLLSAALAGRREVTLDRLVDDLTERLLSAATADSGWVVDAGLWSDWALRDDALQLIRACPGLTIEAESE